MTETSWLFDPIGRIRNISLAPSPKNALQPLFEALMNSIQAIDERFGSENVSSGSVEIRTTANGEGAYTGFIVKDDGIGLNQENMDSFRKRNYSGQNWHLCEIHLSDLYNKRKAQNNCAAF